MKLAIILVILSLSSLTYGQNKTSNNLEKGTKTPKIDLSEACNKDINFWVVQDLPKYKGGEEKLLKNLNDLLTIDNALRGSYYVTFIINCKGKASGFILVEGGINDGLDKNIIKSLAKLQNWESGKYNNENVDCSYTLKLVVENGYIKIEN